jgi:hypothetical protein
MVSESSDDFPDDEDVIVGARYSNGSLNKGFDIVHQTQTALICERQIRFVRTASVKKEYK